MIFHKYQGAGNDFLIADNRSGEIRLDAAAIAALCDRRYGIGADGIMLLEATQAGYDFGMTYYNSDGSGGMMCGNGGRCIVAFARRCGITAYNFIAADGPHHAEIISETGDTCIVRLSMKDVNGIAYYDGDIKGCFLDTGTRHLVCPREDIDRIDVFTAGRELRYREEFAPVGANVNFIEVKGDSLHVRTYEKGVEAETYACGTGITAAAIAAWHYRNNQPTCPSALTRLNEIITLTGDHVHVPISALRDKLSVDFTPTKDGANDVILTGPATHVAEIII